MGIVYEAFDRELETPIALKTLPPQRTHARALARFKREFRMLQDVEHPNLVTLGELIEDGGLWFFTMELVRGEHLIDYVRNGCEHGFDEERLRSAIGQLAAGLHSLHSAGVIHRDIKPANVMVTTEGRTVLLDFGLSVRDTGIEQSTEADFVGTAAYMAPEQALSKQGAPAADWYSVGIILYEALTGRRPYSGTTTFEVLMNKQRYAPPPPRARVPDVPADLDNLCVDLLSVSPNERPSGAHVLARLGVDAPTASSESLHTTSGSRTQTAPFVGRTDELDTIHQAYSATRGGAARVVLVRGESGIGKSALIREFTAELSASDPKAVVLAGRCYERESVPFKAFDGVIDQLASELRRRSDAEVAAFLPRNAGLLPRVFPALGRVEAISCAPLPLGGVAGPQELRTRVFRALRELLSHIAERVPTVLVIDDLQWSDADSWQLMDELLQPPEPPSLLLLGSVRCAPDSEEAREIEALLPKDCSRIELSALDPSTARKLAKVLLERSGMTESPSHIAIEAGGHPLYIDEMVRYIASTGANRKVLRLDDAIRARVASLPSAARSILELVVLAGTPLPRSAIAEASKLPHDAFDKHVSMLRLSNLVRTGGRRATDAIEPYHNRVREAIQESIGPDERRAIHRRLAFVLEATHDAPPELVLGQLEAAGLADKAANLAEMAAGQAARALAFDRAAELYSAAIRLGDLQADHQRTLEIQQAEALVNAGRGPEAAELFLAAADGADPATRRACRRQAAEQLIITGHLDRGLDVLGELLAEIDVTIPATPRRALVGVLWHRARLRLRGLRYRERHETEIAPSKLTQIDVLRAAGLGLAMIDTIRGAAFNARHMRVALDAGHPSRIVPALGMESTYLSSQGSRGRAKAQRIITMVTAIADRSQAPYDRAWAYGIDGGMQYFAGRFVEASETLAKAVDTLRQLPGATWELNNMLMFHLFALRLSGQVLRFRAVHTECVRDAMRRGDRYLETTARRYGSFLWLADDNPDGVLDNLALASWTPPADTFHLQHWYELEAQVERSLYAGAATAALAAQRETFAELDGSLLRRVQTVRATSRWLLGRLHLAAAQETGSGDLQLVARLCRQLDRERTPYADVFASMLRAALARQRGSGDEAATHLRAAMSQAGTEMPLHAACARRHLGLVLGGVDSSDVREADEWMSAEGIARPDRFASMMMPGCA